MSARLFLYTYMDNALLNQRSTLILIFNPHVEYIVPRFLFSLEEQTGESHRLLTISHYNAIVVIFLAVSGHISKNYSIYDRLFLCFNNRYFGKRHPRRAMRTLVLWKKLIMKMCKHYLIVSHIERRKNIQNLCELNRQAFWNT